MVLMTRVLVTGSEGFIGSHLTEALVRQGHDVRAMVLYNSFGSLGWLDDCADEVQGQFDVFLSDVRDPDGVRRAVYGREAVLHLAALIGIPYSYQSPHSYVDTNVLGTLNILEAAREFEVAHVIQTSTSEVYGSAQYVPIDESHPLSAQSPYAATKIAADQMALSYYRSFDTPVTVVRPFNTYGPRQSTRAVIPTIITQMAAGNERINLGSTHATRDFSYVADTVSGFLAALAHPSIVGRVINLGSGFEVSIGDTAALIAGIMGRSLVIETDTDRVRPASSEVERLQADMTLARNELGWMPKRAGLDGFQDGLRRTVEWFLDPANLARYRSGAYSV